MGWTPTCVSLSDDVSSGRYSLPLHVVDDLADLRRRQVLQEVVLHDGVANQLLRSGKQMFNTRLVKKTNFAPSLNLIPPLASASDSEP